MAGLYSQMNNKKTSSKKGGGLYANLKTETKVTPKANPPSTKTSIATEAHKLPLVGNIMDIGGGLINGGKEIISDAIPKQSTSQKSLNTKIGQETDNKKRLELIKQSFKSNVDENKARMTAFSSNVADSATFGVATKIKDKLTNGQGTKDLETSRKLYPGVSNAGSLYGFNGPFKIASKVINPVVKSIAKPLVKGAVKGTLEGGLIGAADSTTRGITNNNLNVKDIAKNTATMALLGAGGEFAAAKLKNKSTTSNITETPTVTPTEPLTTLPDTRTHIATKTIGEKSTLPQKLNKGYIKTFDDLSRLNDFDKAIEKVTNEPLKANNKSYVLGLNSRGNDMVSKQILVERMVDSKNNVIGNSLKSTTKKIPKGMEKDFEDYLINKHAITRMDRGETVFPKEMGMDSQKSLQKVSEYETTHPEFKQLSQEIYDYNNKLGKAWLVDTGIIKPEEWDGYLKANPNYVPMNRLFGETEKGMFRSGKKGFASQTNPVKSAPGSQRKIISPIESIIEHTGQYVKTAKQNEVMQTLINNLNKNAKELNGWAEIVKGQNDNVANILNTEGPEGVLNQIATSFENASKKTNLTNGNVVTGIVNGEKVHVKVNDVELLNALTNLSPQGQNILIQGVGKVTKVMKLLTTGINPVFSLTRNIFRDIPTAFINSKSTNNPLKFSYDLVDSLISVIGNKELYKSYKGMGGGHSSSISSSRNALLEAKNSIIKTNPSIKKGFQKGLSALERLNDAVETAPRLGEFKRLSKDGSYESKVKGLFEANDVTVNFSKRGQWSKEVDQVIPYFNAAMQGIDKTIRTFKDNPVQASAKAFSAITIPTIALYAINHDNPEYNKISNYIKDSNFLIPKADGTFFKIPKPRELGVAFGSDVERILRAWIDKDPKAGKDFLETIRNNFAPPTRTVLHPALVDLTANKNFMGAPIVPQDMINDKRSEKNQYDTKTSEVSKFIGDKLNVSPMKLDYLAKSYGGGLAELALPATTKNTSIGQTLKQKVTVDPAFSNDILKIFYEDKTKLERAKADNKTDGLKDNRLDILKLKKYNKVQDKISDIRKEMKKVQGDSSLEKNSRLLKVRELQEKINKLAGDMNNK